VCKKYLFDKFSKQDARRKICNCDDTQSELLFCYKHAIAGKIRMCVRISAVRISDAFRQQSTRLDPRQFPLFVFTPLSLSYMSEP
jgi:hypothetical protein